MTKLSRILFQGTGHCPKVRRRFNRQGNIWITAVFSLFVGYGITAPQLALGASWEAVCTNVTNNSSNRDLWFDSPGAGVAGDNNEAGFFWLKTDSGANEKCTYNTSAGGPDYISSTTFPTLRVRVAVNDGARFKVEVFGQSFVGDDLCSKLVGSITTSSTEDDSSFRTKELTLPPGNRLCGVAITLDDDPDNSPGIDSGRVSALIDYIHIRNASAIEWGESFAAGNP